MPSTRFLNKLPNNCINLLYEIFCPYFCTGCFQLDRTGYLCNDCLLQNDFGLGIYCLKCGRRRPTSEDFLKTCCEPNLKSLISFADYENKAITNLIHLGKFQGYFETIRFLGKLISPELAKIKSILRDFTLVSIPASSQTQLKRRFNQSRVLAEVIKAELGLSISDCLMKVKDNLPQRQLPANKRPQNIKDVFAAQASPPLKILLVDDIKTTGATLLEAAAVLRAAGAKTILGLTIVK